MRIWYKWFSKEKRRIKQEFAIKITKKIKNYFSTRDVPSKMLNCGEIYHQLD